MLAERIGMACQYPQIPRSPTGRRLRSQPGWAREKPKQTATATPAQMPYQMTPVITLKTAPRRPPMRMLRN